MLFSGMIHNQLLQLARIDHGFGVIVEQFSKKAMCYPASIADRLAEAHNGFSKQRWFLFRTLWIMRVLHGAQSSRALRCSLRSEENHVGTPVTNAHLVCRLLL